MLSYQHNSIRCISRLEQLPQLTILDMFSNNIQSLQSLQKAPALRGLMLGRNYLTQIDTQDVSPCLLFSSKAHVTCRSCSSLHLQISINMHQHTCTLSD